MTPYPHDPEKAKQLLPKRYPNDSDHRSVDAGRPCTLDKEIAQVISAQLGRVGVRRK